MSTTSTECEKCKGTGGYDTGDIHAMVGWRERCSCGARPLTWWMHGVDFWICVGLMSLWLIVLGLVVFGGR